jgi:ATP-dependent DNA helicase RecG
MAANGSPAPLFESDESRTAFVIRLPVHAGARVPPRAETGSPEVTPEVTPEVHRLLEALEGEPSRQELQQALGLKDAEHFRKTYLLPALAAGVVEMTLPATPRSSKQRYRLASSGRSAKERA